VNVFFPKFELDWKMDLTKLIFALGLDNTNPDYSKITNGLKISNVIHQSFIKVDEKETEVAAATVITGMDMVFIPEKKEYVFNADHPFVYMIVDDSDGKILFMGKFLKP
jgi:serpin B